MPLSSLPGRLCPSPAVRALTSSWRSVLHRLLWRRLRVHVGLLRRAEGGLLRRAEGGCCSEAILFRELSFVLRMHSACGGFCSEAYRIASLMTMLEPLRASALVARTFTAACCGVLEVDCCSVLKVASAAERSLLRVELCFMDAQCLSRPRVLFVLFVSCVCACFVLCVCLFRCPVWGCVCFVRLGWVALLVA